MQKFCFSLKFYFPTRIFIFKIYFLICYLVSQDSVKTVIHIILFNFMTRKIYMNENTFYSRTVRTGIRRLPQLILFFGIWVGMYQKIMRHKLGFYERFIEKRTRLCCVDLVLWGQWVLTTIIHITALLKHLTWDLTWDLMFEISHVKSQMRSDVISHVRSHVLNY